MIIGIDIGSTTTKAVLFDNKKVLKKIKTKASDAITSGTGAFGKIVLENNLEMSRIEKIMITGVGALNIENNFFGIKTEKVDEFTSIGLGAMFQSGKDKIVVANIGTGTVLIQAEKDKITHLGGTGVGGGTILGLSKKMLQSTTFNDIMKMADKGKINQVDLLVADLLGNDLSFLGKDATAANFGKMLDGAEREDIALGIINLVYQVIGVLSVFAARAQNYDTVIVTGSGGDNHIGKKIFDAITQIYKVKFEFPDCGEWTTAIGAALSAHKHPNSK
ncbi:MAG: type II pantothenate kinase [Termitinemataceae bacterium]|nr:MAG: type II pantothenate kinase [Termitinemataceae bacterium]